MIQNKEKRIKNKDKKKYVGIFALNNFRVEISD